MSEPILLDGTATAKTIRAEVAARVRRLQSGHGVTPGLAAVLAGDNPASVTYVRMKRRACEKAGIASFSREFSRETTQEGMMGTIRELNANPDVHGILVQHPLPAGLDENAILAAVSPAKDVDGLGRGSLGDLMIGHPEFVACTADGMIELLDRYNLPIAGKHAVVIGRSLIVGKPMALLLLNRHATVTVCHSKTENLADFTRQADILVAAVGRPEMIRGDMLKPGVVVLDAGYNRVPGRDHDVGDCDFASCAEVASAITPVPGGVGPMTIAVLLSNTVKSAERSVREAPARVETLNGAFDLDAYVASRIALVAEGLDLYTPPADAPPATLHRAMRYSLLAGGKRLRPLLCMAAAEAVGGNAAEVLPTACALEMIHTFSLIHDDLPAIDNDDYRRGMPTSHREFGEAMAILAGDALHTLAFSVIAARQRLSGSVESCSAVLRVIGLVAEACGEAGMVGGQVDDIYYEGRDITGDTLRKIHERKTGALLNASILSGAILAGASDAEERAFQGYGDNIGLAFQIIDDVLDVTGNDGKLGKPTGSDVKNDKATYPKVFGVERSLELAVGAADRAVAALSAMDERAAPLRAFARFVVERDV